MLLNPVQVTLGILVDSVPRDAVDNAITAFGVRERRSDGKLPAHVINAPPMIRRDIDACQYVGHCGFITLTAALPPLAVVCCTRLTRQPLSADAAADLARTLKSIADPARLRLLSLIAAHDSGAACVCDLTEPLGLTQPTVSHHLKVLVDAGLLTRDKRGVWASFTLLPGALDSLAVVLSTQ